MSDTFVAAVDPPAAAGQEGHDDPFGFFRRTAADLDAATTVAELLDAGASEEELDGLLRLLDLLRLLGLNKVPQRVREALVHGLGRLSPDVARGLDAFRQATFAACYSLPTATGPNPNWAQVGYPGPPPIPEAHERPPRIATHAPPRRATDEVLHADVVVVGSGSGGSVIAGELARSGLDVVVLEEGGHYEEAEFPHHEVDAYRRLYWRGAITPTADGNLHLLAGATLGGGSTVNWSNAVPTPESVRSSWAREYGLAGLDTSAFDRHLDAVSVRIGVTDACSDPVGCNARLSEGAKALGWQWHAALRNADPATYSVDTAGHLGFGDRSGSKQSTLHTYLADASDAGARILVRCRAEQILTHDGRARGVVAVWRRADESPVRLTVEAPTVVAAGGALETPALLLRSGIGGPAVGRHLRLHPTIAVYGAYSEPQRVWRGAPQTIVVDEFTDLIDGFGFLAEAPHFGLALTAGALPWKSARQHKLLLGRGSHLASLIAVTRDHAGGRVTIDDRGRAAVTYALDDPIDSSVRARALEALVRLHAAAGASVVGDLHPTVPVWRRTDDLARFVGRIQALPSGRRGRPLFSAHQMGTARMGRDPASSVADPDGQLHDTPGVWIGDTSAFPTACGANPMLTCMALARRTATAMRA